MDDDLVRARRYRDRAAHLREIASEEKNPVVQRELLALADEYDRLCAELLRRRKRQMGRSGLTRCSTSRQSSDKHLDNRSFWRATMLPRECRHTEHH